MLSVVLYGRNDSHGYNLHKRAAISLNAIAELLDHADDEILFVDYNTPDDLPTFPEAIADTLTAKAAERLKIFRVRPKVHRERFAARTHLDALEPIARNVAIRRSNPANRWILSTNTDMIFCPLAEGSSLSGIAAKLEDGFYHLPRFELPEGLWETLDRKDGPGAISFARACGERWHLNEITLADRDNVYDAPGDFQLCLRQDLFDIDGFHEEMILGWHLDANMAKRMRLKRGKVSSAVDHLIGYHCDHTRLASPYHKADRLENDQVRFDEMVKIPGIPEQKGTWGLADVEVETFALSDGSAKRYRLALEATIPTPLSGFLQSQYLLEDYGRLDYALDHVLPYLLDLVSCIPSNSRIGYVGARTDTYEAFAKGWAAMGGAQITVLDQADWLEAGGAASRAVPLNDWLDCSLFIFEVGAEAAIRHSDLNEQESARLWQVDQAFKAVIDSDRARRTRRGEPTRVVVVNGVHNFFEPQMMAEVAVTLTPYSSRIRHGYVADRVQDRIKTASLDQATAMRALKALQPLTADEFAKLTALGAALATAGEDDAIWVKAGRLGAEIEALVGVGLVDVGSDVTGVIARVRAARASNAPAAAGATDSAAGRDASSRLVRVEDWDDPTFAHTARKLFANRNHALLWDRNIWTWERVALAQNLMAALPPGDRSRVLVIGGAPELLAYALAYQGYAVDIAEPSGLAAGDLTSHDWRSEFEGRGWVSPRPVGLIEDQAEAIAGGMRYDAVLVSQNGLFLNERPAIPDVLKTLTGLLRTGGHLGLSTVTQPAPMDERQLAHALPYGLTAGGAFGLALQRWAGLELDGAVDMRITPRTFDRTAGDAELPPLIVNDGAEAEVTGVWAFRRTAAAPDWDGLRVLLDSGVYREGGPGAATSISTLFSTEDLAWAPSGEGSAVLGPMIHLLTPSVGVTKTPLGLHVPAAFGPGVAATASIGRVAAGRFDLYVEAEIGPASESGILLAAAIVRDGQILAEVACASGGSEVCLLETSFEIGDTSPKGLSILLKVWGLADLTIPTLALR